MWAKFNNEVPQNGSDLDPNAMIYLLVDTIHPKKETLGHRGPFNKLMNELIRLLASTLPSLTIKTVRSSQCGFIVFAQVTRIHNSSLANRMHHALSFSCSAASSRSPSPSPSPPPSPPPPSCAPSLPPAYLSLTFQTQGNSDKPTLETALGFASSLAVAMEAMLSGSPLLFLDMRSRPLLQSPDRETLIANAKEGYEAICNEMLEHGVAETFDAMSIAYFHDVLYGDGNHFTTETYQDDGGVRSIGARCPLFEAIERAAEGAGAIFAGALAPATVQQVNETSTWLANKFFADAWAIQPVSVKEKAAAVGMHEYATCTSLTLATCTPLYLLVSGFNTQLR